MGTPEFVVLLLCLLLAVFVLGLQLGWSTARHIEREHRRNRR